MTPGPISSERMIAATVPRAAMWVSSGPGPWLPFSPIWWQARQPDWAAISLPASYRSGTSISISAGSPTEIEMDVPERYEAGKLIAAQSGCLACHQIGENGNHGPGPELTHIAARGTVAAIIRSLEIGPGVMPAYADLSPEKLNQLADFLASLD